MSADVPVSHSDDSEEAECESMQSEYEKRQHKAIKAWEEIREKLLCGAIESVTIPLHTICKFCNEEEATVLCKQCGSQAYFCEQCALSLHAQINIFHMPIIQKVIEYVYSSYKHTVYTCALQSMNYVGQTCEM